VIASENEDEIMQGAVMAAEAAAMGSLDAEDKSTVVDVSGGSQSLKTGCSQSFLSWSKAT
jgi:hypothetical protein